MEQITCKEMWGAARLTMAHHSVPLTACSLMRVCIRSGAASLAMAESHWALANGEDLGLRKTRIYSRNYREVSLVDIEDSMSKCGGIFLDVEGVVDWSSTWKWGHLLSEAKISGTFF